MKLNKTYIFLTILLFLIELCIALFIRDKFIRPILGDVLVVVLMFTFCKIFYQGNTLKLVFAVVLFAFVVEIAQYFKLATALGIEDNKIAKVVLGTTFDWIDLFAYTIGGIASYFLAKKMD